MGLWKTPFLILPKCVFALNKKVNSKNTSFGHVVGGLGDRNDDGEEFLQSLPRFDGTLFV